MENNNMDNEKEYDLNELYGKNVSYGKSKHNIQVVFNNQLLKAKLVDLDIDLREEFSIFLVTGYKNNDENPLTCLTLNWKMAVIQADEFIDAKITELIIPVNCLRGYVNPEIERYKGVERDTPPDEDLMNMEDV